mmetsp:Transcript_26789/g.78910  ORF Transcript_26789/g.78910 Transcript_26789/m.78910 type:complete len:324 (+) Transcript_26789:218-1189(+)
MQVRRKGTAELGQHRNLQRRDRLEQLQRRGVGEPEVGLRERAEAGGQHPLADVRVERLVRPAEVLDQLLEDREALPLQRQIGALDAPLQQPPQRRVEQRQVVGVAQHGGEVTVDQRVEEGEVAAQQRVPFPRPLRHGRAPAAAHLGRHRPLQRGQLRKDSRGQRRDHRGHGGRDAPLELEDDLVDQRDGGGDLLRIRRAQEVRQRRLQRAEHVESERLDHPVQESHRLSADFAARAERAEGGEAELDRSRERVARPRVRQRREALRHCRDDRDAVRRLHRPPLLRLDGAPVLPAERRRGGGGGGGGGRRRCLTERLQLVHRQG